jgi:hypothetical protein
MTNELKLIRDEFTARMDKLEAARKQLKKEFIGIDEPINQIIDNVRSWYTMSALQNRPAIVNLWGLTGVGKTSVLFRLMELLNLKDVCYHFDMGEKSGSYSFSEKFDELGGNDEDSPIVIILDEFQLARTIRQGLTREEVQEDKSRMVWELIDSGKISQIKWRRGMFELMSYAAKLERLVLFGLEAKNGKVLTKKYLFAKEVLHYSEKNLAEFDENQPLDLVPDFIQSTIQSEVGKELGLVLYSDIEEHVEKLDVAETLEFVQKAMALMKRPKIKQFTQAIIFIVGNMDEAYRMHENYSADIEADEFHQLSLHVKLPLIKSALRDRFRDEQIARLGNTHVIYPALRCRDYEQIIEQELVRITEAIVEKYGVQLEFDATVMRKIYREGVFPTQGVRPVLTTIQQLVKSNISVFFEQIFIQGVNADSIRITASGDELIGIYQQGNQAQFKHSIKLLSLLDKLRKNTNDDRQAITAVHEAGHAVVTTALFNEFPEYILSVTSDAESHGFVYTKFKRKFLTRQDLMGRVAVFLGGIAAEEIVYGAEFLTDGNSSDIERAYQFVNQFFKEEGFGSEPLFIASHPYHDKTGYHQTEKTEEEMRQLILAGKTLAIETLQREKKLLLLTAGFLSKNNRMDKAKFKEFVEKYATQSFESPIAENYFQDKLRSQIETLGVLEETMENLPVFLNKG